jgi:cytochrome P450
MQKDAVGFLRGVAREYGDVAHFTYGPQHLYLFSHPEGVYDVLVRHGRSFQKGKSVQRTKVVVGQGLTTAEGELHKRQRRLVQPAFHRQRIAGYAEVMIDRASRIRDRWSDGQEFDLHREMMALTLSVVAKTLFNADLDEEVDVIGKALSDLLESFPLLILPFSEHLFRLPLPPVRRLEAARARLDRIIYGIIADRRRSQHDQGDLLSMLLMAQDDEGDGSGMSDEQLRDECLAVLLAGHETIANTLTWTLYLLSRNPDAERELHAELDRVLGGRPPTPADYPSLPYAEMVIAESMRIFPSVWGTSRLAMEDVSIGGWTVPQGSMAIVAPSVTQTDPRWWPDPLRFDPLRFTPEAKAARPRMAYFPFGGGTRICIGESFAWMEGVLMLATLAQKWRVQVTSEPQPRASFTLRPRGGMPARVELRSPVATAERPVALQAS